MELCKKYVFQFVKKTTALVFLRPNFNFDCIVAKDVTWRHFRNTSSWRNVNGATLFPAKKVVSTWKTPNSYTWAIDSLIQKDNFLIRSNRSFGDNFFLNRLL